ncbi:MAG: hypothetical protein ABJG41_05280 [Cyclobacteriaceae bacterium]
MMRSFFLLYLIALCFTASAQQRYISSAIIAFSGKAYERTISDINIALLDERNLSKEDRSKAYFYRGMARLKLIDAGASTVTDPYLSAFQDFRQVMNLNLEAWSGRANAAAEELFDELMADATAIRQLAVREDNGQVKLRLLNRTLDHLNAARIIHEDYHITKMLGETYLSLGVIHGKTDESRSLANYRASLRYMEQALRVNNDCEVCISSLIEIAMSIGDAEREERYKLLMRSFLN